LLKFDVLVVCQQYIPVAIGYGEKVTILFVGNSNILNGPAIVTRLDEGILKASREAFIDEDSHVTKRAMRSAFASSRAAMALSRETAGKSIRNSSMVSPPSR
jgi:hypothetical protein